MLKSKGQATDEKSMEPARSSPAIAPAAGRVGVRLLFAFWALGSVGVLVGLARTACDVPAANDPAASALTNRANGWRLEHWLPANRPLTPRLMELLEQRGPRPGVVEEIHFDRRQRDSAGITRFSRAGWKTVVDGTETRRSPEPELRIFAPDGSLAWHGGYRAGELAGKGVVLLDDVVLVRLIRGESGPDHVPVGCSVSLRRETKSGLGWLGEVRR